MVQTELPTRYKTPREMQQVMSPHVKELCKDMKARWPQVDPELILLLWICERHKLHPPTGRLDLWRRDVPVGGMATPRTPTMPSTLADARPNSAKAGGSRKKVWGQLSTSPSPDAPAEATATSDLRPVQVSLPPARRDAGQRDRDEAVAQARSAGAQRDEAAAQMEQGPLPSATKKIQQGNPDPVWQSAMSTAAATSLVEVQQRSPHVQPPPPPPSKWSFKPDDYQYRAYSPDEMPGRPDSMASLSTRYASPSPDMRDERWTISPSPELWAASEEVKFQPGQGKKRRDPETVAALDNIVVADWYPAPEDYNRTPVSSRMAPCLKTRLSAIRDDTAQVDGASLRSVSNVVDLLHEDAQKHASWEANPSGRDIHTFERRIAAVRNEVRGRFIRNVPLLSLEVLTSDEQFWINSKATPICYAKGDMVVEEGQMGDDLYIVESGSCIITKLIKGEARRICDIRAGGHFGELAVMYDIPRSATVSAAGHVKLLKLSREDIFSIVSKESVDKMKNVGRIQFFRSFPMLSKLDREALGRMIKAMRCDEWAEGEDIITAGQRYPPERRRLYFLEKGECEVTQGQVEMKKRTPGSPRKSKRGTVLAAKFMSIQTGTTGVGSFFGMFELIYNCPHLTSVSTYNEVVTLSISYDELKLAMGEEAQRLFTMMRKSLRVQILRQAHELLTHCDEEELAALIDSIGFKTFQPWEVIMRKGQLLNGLFVLEEGSCLGDEVLVESLMENLVESTDCAEHNRPGDTFGTRNTARISDADAKFSVVAISQCSVLHIPCHVMGDLESKRSLWYESASP